MSVSSNGPSQAWAAAYAKHYRRGFAAGTAGRAASPSAAAPADMVEAYLKGHRDGLASAERAAARAEQWLAKLGIAEEQQKWRQRAITRSVVLSGPPPQASASSVKIGRSKSAR